MGSRWLRTPWKYYLHIEQSVFINDQKLENDGYNENGIEANKVLRAKMISKIW